MIDRNIAPSYIAIDKIEFQQPKTETLNNNIPVHIISAGTQPVLRLEIIFKAGIWYEPSVGVSYFTTKMLNEGTKSFSSKQISDLLDKYGAQLELNTEFDVVNIKFRI
jgi:zinc protease